MPQPGPHYEANDIPLADHIHTPIAPPYEAPIVPRSREEALHGGYDDEDITPPTQESETPTPPKRGIIQTVKTGFFAGLGRHSGKEVTTQNAFGKEVVKTLKSRDVFEIEQESFARLRATESKDKWDPKSVEGLNGWQRFGKSVERFFDRTWRTMATEKVHFAKEKKHGMELSATVGIDSAISEEFHAILDTAARKKLAEERNTGWKRFTGGTKDFFQEFLGQERDLHKFKVAEAARLAAEYRTNPADTSHPLYQLINRDTATRENFAARINESPLELLHQTNAQDKKVEGLKLDSVEGKKVDTFLKKQIIEKAMDDIISRNQLSGDRSGKINAKLRRELDQTIQDYLIGDEFQAWRSTLTEEQQKAYENSFTVASDILLQFEEGMAPAILDNLEHYKGADRLNFEIELSLGTAQMSANTESMGGTYKERHTERASLNEKIWNRTQSKDLHSNEAINTGLKREKLLSAASMIWRNEAVAAFLGAATGRGVATLARAGFSWLPVVGSMGIAGAMAGFKEWARHGQMRSTYGMGRAEGLEFPDASNAIRTAEMRSADYNRVGLSERTQRFVDLSTKLGSDNFDNNTILLTMAQIADSGARLQLGNERDINLLVASKDGPEGRGIRNRELRIHDQARAVSTAKVRELLSDPTRLSAIATEMGFTIVAGSTPEQAIDQMLGVLQTSQYYSLLGNTTVSPEIAALVTKVNTLSPDLAYNPLTSVRARDKIYNGLRWKSTGKKVATSAAVAGLLSYGMTEYAEAHQSVIDSGTEHQLVPLIDHKLPQHVDSLSTGEIHDTTTGDVLAVMHARVPAGTHLVAVHERVGGPDDLEARFNLVTDHLAADGQPEVLVRNMEIGGDGQVQMTTEIRDALLHNHLELKHEALAPVEWGGHETTGTPEIDYTKWNNTLEYGKFPGEDIHGFFAQNVNSSLAAHPEISVDGEPLAPVERITDITGLGNFMRGMENWVYKQENFQVDQIEGYNRVLHDEDTMWSALTGNKEVISEWQSSTTKILHVPDLLATEEGNRRVVDLIHEAVRENPTGDIHHQFSDEAHRIAWEMSYWGDEAHIPDANETITLLQYFGEIPTTGTVENTLSAIPHDISITMTEDFSKVMEVPAEQIFTPGWASVFSSTIGYSRPLEAPVLGAVSAGENSGYYEGYAYMNVPRERFSKIGKGGIKYHTMANQNSLPTAKELSLLDFNGRNGVTTVESGNESEAKNQLDVLRTNVKDADNIFMVLPYHIGDATCILNYFNALEQKVAKINPGATFSYVVPPTIYGILKPLETGKIKVINGLQEDPRLDPSSPDSAIKDNLNGVTKAIEIINSDPNIKNAVILEAERVVATQTNIVQAMANNKKVTYMSDLFVATHKYNNEIDGDKRYSNFAHELMGDESVTIDNLQSGLIPEYSDEDAVYNQILTDNHIDSTKKQVSVILESGSAGRQYSIDQWVQACKKIQEKEPDTTFNFIYNPNKNAGDPTLVDLTKLSNAITTAGLNNHQLVHGNLKQIIALLRKQKLVMANDGGTFHLAANLAKGPNVVGLFWNGFPHYWNSNPSKAVALEAPAWPNGRSWSAEWGEKDESKKWLNQISIDDIAKVALEKLA